jgi:hypothetical protein
MLNAIRGLLKFSVVAVFVLVLGNWIHWGGRTLSDEVKTQMSHAERVPVSQYWDDLKDWAARLVRDARKGAPSRSRIQDEEISDSEKRKLRSLIQELNSTTARD